MDGITTEVNGSSECAESAFHKEVSLGFNPSNAAISSSSDRSAENGGLGITPGPRYALSPRGPRLICTSRPTACPRARGPQRWRSAFWSASSPDNSRTPGRNTRVSLRDERFLRRRDDMAAENILFPREIFRRDEEDQRRRPSPGVRGTRRSPASFSHRRGGLTKYPSEKIRGTAGVVRELCGLARPRGKRSCTGRPSPFPYLICFTWNVCPAIVIVPLRFFGFPV